MKLIIAGGRDYSESFEDFETELLSYLVTIDEYTNTGISEVIHGCCLTGADTLAQEFIEVYGLTASHYPAEWKKYGKAAGPMRNREMVEHGDYLIAFWNGKSRGTADIIRAAERHGLNVHIVRY